MTVDGLSVVVPAFDEEETLASSLTVIRDNLKDLEVPFEILVVNDGSNDRTGEIAESVAAADPLIRVLHHERNHRIGAALQTGALAARHDWIALVPVDNPIPTVELRRMIAAAADAAIVVGYRDGRPGYTSWMRFASGAYHVLLTVLFGMRLKDFNWCCLYRRDVLRAVPIQHPGIIALPEILIRARRHGYRLVEVPLSMRPRAPGKRRSTVSRARTMMAAFHDALSLCWDLRVRDLYAPRTVVAAAEEKRP